MAIPLLPVHTENKKWYGLHIPIPAWVMEWVEKNVQKDQIIRRTDPKEAHLTLIYGNKASDCAAIHTQVLEEKFTSQDLEFAGLEFVQPKHTRTQKEAYWVLNVKSDRLMRCKQRLETQYLGQTQGVDLHLTLAVVQRIPALEQALGDFSFLVRLRAT